MAGDNAAVSAHIFSPGCEFPGFCVLELNPDVSSPSPLQISTLKQRENQIPAVCYLVGGLVGNNVFRGMNLMKAESNITVHERPIIPAVVWVSMDIPGQKFPEK